MMLIALLCGSDSHKAVVADGIKRAASSLFNVKIYTGRNTNPGAKSAQLKEFLLQRNEGNALNIITGAETIPEFNILTDHDAQICILPGGLSRIFCRHNFPILPEYLFVTAYPYLIEDRRTRAQYVTPEEIFSTSYARYRGFAEVSA